MGKKDDAEEAVFEPTGRRLQQLRKDGQVPRSQDFTGAFSLIAVVIFLIATWNLQIGWMTASFVNLPLTQPENFLERLDIAIGMMSKLLLYLVLPISVITIFSGLLASILDTKGFIFATKAMAPNFAKLNPADNIKNIFSVKTTVELIKGSIKLVIFFWVTYLIVRKYLNDLVWAPTCGLNCLIETVITMSIWIIAVGIILLIVAAGIDLVLSRWLFTRDNKMTLTEMKRDQKEDYGDPYVRSARKQERQRLAQSAGLSGFNAANLVIAAPHASVAIAYKPEMSSVPVVSAKGSGATGLDFIKRALEKGVPVVDDIELVDQLMELGKVGDMIPQTLFTPVAQALIRAGFTE